MPNMQNIPIRTKAGKAIKAAFTPDYQTMTGFKELEIMLYKEQTEIVKFYGDDWTNDEREQVEKVIMYYYSSAKDKWAVYKDAPNNFYAQRDRHDMPVAFGKTVEQLIEDFHWFYSH